MLSNSARNARYPEINQRTKKLAISHKISKLAAERIAQSMKIQSDLKLVNNLQLNHKKQNCMTQENQFYTDNDEGDYSNNNNNNNNNNNADEKDKCANNCLEQQDIQDSYYMMQGEKLPALLNQLERDAKSQRMHIRDYNTNNIQQSSNRTEKFATVHEHDRNSAQISSFSVPKMQISQKPKSFLTLKKGYYLPELWNTKMKQFLEQCQNLQLTKRILPNYHFLKPIIKKSINLQAITQRSKAEQDQFAKFKAKLDISLSKSVKTLQNTSSSVTKLNQSINSQLKHIVQFQGYQDQFVQPYTQAQAQPKKIFQHLDSNQSSQSLSSLQNNSEKSLQKIKPLKLSKLKQELENYKYQLFLLQKLKSIDNIKSQCENVLESSYDQQSQLNNIVMLTSKTYRHIFKHTE